MRGLLAGVLLWAPLWAGATAFEPTRLPSLEQPIVAETPASALRQTPVPLELANPGALAVPVPPILPETLIPGVEPQLRQTTLPPGAVDLGAIQPSVDLGSRNPRRAQERREALRVIEEWAEGYQKAADAGLDAERARNAELFERPAAAQGSVPAPETVALPRGVQGVTVDEVDDRGVGPYLRYTYHAPKGQFTGIDLKSRPELVDRLPDDVLKPQERVAIRKIQAYNKDLRVLLVEGNGKTPDLDLGGVVTELKSWPIAKMDLTHIVDRANSQVGEHAERHGSLGKGAVIVDIIGAPTAVPVQDVLRELNAWAKLPVGTEIRVKISGKGYRETDAIQIKGEMALDRVTVFAGNDVKVFARGPNGFGVLETDDPFAPFQVSGHRPKRARPEAARPASAIGDAYEKARIIGDLRAFKAQGRATKAFNAWAKFQRTHRPEVVASARREAEAILERIRRQGQKRRGGRRR